MPISKMPVKNYANIKIACVIHCQKGSSMLYVSLQTAIALTGLSERTLRRKIANGQIKIPLYEKHSRTILPLEDLKNNIDARLDQNDMEIIKNADSGNVQAQCDVGLIFLEQGKYNLAIYWLELATSRNYPDAMHLLGKCYLNGDGVIKDKNTAIMWIAKAASLGHPVAIEQMKSIGRIC